MLIRYVFAAVMQGERDMDQSVDEMIVTMSKQSPEGAHRLGRICAREALRVPLSDEEKKEVPTYRVPTENAWEAFSGYCEGVSDEGIETLREFFLEGYREEMARA